MSDLLAWAFGDESPVWVQIAAIILGAAVSVALAALTVAGLVYGLGWLVLAAWVAIPAFLVIEGYKRRGDK